MFNLSRCLYKQVHRYRYGTCEVMELFIGQLQDLMSMPLYPYCWRRGRTPRARTTLARV